MKDFALPADEMDDAAPSLAGVALINATSGSAVGLASNVLITIQDNDPGVHLSAVAAVSEDVGRTILAVLRGNDIDMGPFTVDYEMVDVTATAKTDYIARSGTLAFAAGQQSAAIDFQVLNDGRREGPETVRFTLTNVL